MSPLALTMVLVFWLPPAVVIFYNLFWDTHFWQSKDYRFDRMTQHLRWDFALSHRRPLLTYIKIILFGLLLSFIVFPGAIAPLVAILVAFAVWVSEVFNIAEKFLNHRVAYVESSIRNYAILILGIVILAMIPVLLSMYFLTINPPEFSVTTASLVPIVTNAGLEVIPLTYVFLTFSALLAIAYDLASPVISAVLVILTSPLGWLETQFYALVAKMFLMRHKNLLTIAITGSYNKTTTRQILEHMLGKEYRIASTAFTETTISRLAMAIITDLKPSTQVFIAELNAYKPGQMEAMAKLLKPQLVVFTGIDESHIGLFGSLENTLATKSEILQHLSASSSVIYNGDDKQLNSVAGKNNNKEVFYHIRHDPHADLPENQLEVDNYYITGLEEKGRTLNFTLHNQTREMQVTAPAATKSVMSSLLGAIAAAVEAGLSLDQVRTTVKDLPAALFEPELLTGDDRTLLINEPRTLTLKGFENLLGHLRTTHAPQRILVTTGISELGKYKRNVYSGMSQEISASADVVITYDQHLAETIKSDNLKLEVILVGSIDEVIYTVRSLAVKGAAILLAGQLDPSIAAALRDE